MNTSFTNLIYNPRHKKPNLEVGIGICNWEKTAMRTPKLRFMISVLSITVLIYLLAGNDNVNAFFGFSFGVDSESGPSATINVGAPIIPTRCGHRRYILHGRRQCPYCIYHHDLHPGIYIGPRPDIYTVQPIHGKPQVFFGMNFDG